MRLVDSGTTNAAAPMCATMYGDATKPSARQSDGGCGGYKWSQLDTNATDRARSLGLAESLAAVGDDVNAVEDLGVVGGEECQDASNVA